MSAIDQVLNELKDEFDLLGDWEERYRYVIELGRELAPLNDAERTDPYKVRGCASQVWLVTEPQPSGALAFRGDSDAHPSATLEAGLHGLHPLRAGPEGGRPQALYAAGNMSTTLARDEVIQVANLARLKLSEAEIDAMTG